MDRSPDRPHRPLPSQPLLAVLALLALAASAAAAAGNVGCDFDADGFDDLAIGVLREEVGGVWQAGAAHLLYGGAFGLSILDDQVLTEDSPGMADNPDELERFGVAFACGDFDGDGFDDLAIGVDAEPTRGSAAGAVHILPGSFNGLWGAESRLLRAADVGLPAVPGARFGSALASGDFDGDGFADLAVGARGDAVAARPSAGSVTVFYGEPEGLSASSLNQHWHQGAPGVPGELNEEHWFGAVLTAGDFDGDLHDDLAIGVPGDRGHGSVVVLYGGPALGLTVNGAEHWHQDSPFVADQAESGDRCGGAVAAGDFDGDGRDDLAWGCPGEAVYDTREANGVVHVLYGCLAGLCGPGGQLLHQDVPGVEGSVDWDDNFGAALSAANFDGDADDDLAVGAPLDGSSEDLPFRAGVVNVFYGGTAGLTGGELWHQDRQGIEGSAAAQELFGFHLTSGDFDGDGAADLAVGVPKDDAAGLSSGSVNVLYGSPSGLDSAGSELWNPNHPGIEGAAEQGEWFGVVGTWGDYRSYIVW